MSRLEDPQLRGPASRSGKSRHGYSGVSCYHTLQQTQGGFRRQQGRPGTSASSPVLATAGSEAAQISYYIIFTSALVS